MSAGDYAGRRVVVTGCASGIGEALAHLLAARGADVVGLDRQPSSAPLAAFHSVDLADSSSIAAAATAVGTPVHGLFNVAGMSGTIGPATIVGVIRMNCVAPGTTDTPIIEATRRSRGDAFLKAIPMPLGRLAEPREQAEVLAFLNSPAASYVNGQVIWVDGGYMAGVATGRFEDRTGSVGTVTRQSIPSAP